jgi:TPR repeat protein
MKTKSLRCRLLFLLMLPIIPLYGQAQETNHVTDKLDPVQSGAIPVVEATPQFEATKAKAETGDAQAQYNLAECYANGQDVAKDEIEALKWFRKAAEQNYAPAQCELANCYYYGLTVAQGYAEAVKWYRKAAEQNNAAAQSEMQQVTLKVLRWEERDKRFIIKEAQMVA